MRTFFLDQTMKRISRLSLKLTQLMLELHVQTSSEMRNIISS